MDKNTNKAGFLNERNSFEGLCNKIERRAMYTTLRLNNLDPEKYSIMTEDILKDLEFSLKGSSENRVVRVNYMHEKPTVAINGLNYEVEIPLSRQSKPKFTRKYKGKIFFCVCTIKYTKEWGTLSLHDVKPLDIEKAIERWEAYISQDKFLTGRIDRIVEIMGLDPSKLLFREKITFGIARLLPLAVEKYSLMDFGPKKRGKTTAYKKFEIHGKAFSITRASVVYNSGTKQYGDMFNTISDVFLVEEAQNITDSEFWTFLQIYTDGNRGEIIFSPTEVIRATVSFVILGNPNINVDFLKIFADKINIFQNTGIPLKKGEAGGAKLSRIDAMLYSGGCRNISPRMHLDTDEEAFPLCIFKQALFELRKKHIDIKKLLSILNLPRLNDDRIEISGSFQS